MSEKSLHADLKNWYARPGDQLEARLDGYFIDIQRDDLLIEIQTANFSQIKPKLLDLLPRYRLRLIYPIAAEKWIVKLPKDEHAKLSRRKSPKRGRYLDLFNELVSFPNLIHNPNFSLEVVMIQEEEIRRHVPGKRWRRRGWSTAERSLVGVVEQRVFNQPGDLKALIPASLPDPFTSLDLAATLEMPRWLAQKTAYCLREMGASERIGSQRRAHLYSWTDG